MSRCLTLEEYLQEFVDENTQPAGTEGITLLVTNQQAQTLGFFLINGLAGFVERMRLDSKSEDNDRIPNTDDDIRHDENSEEFIN